MQGAAVGVASCDRNIFRLCDQLRNMVYDYLAKSRFVSYLTVMTIENKKLIYFADNDLINTMAVLLNYIYLTQKYQ